VLYSPSRCCEETVTTPVEPLKTSAVRRSLWLFFALALAYTTVGIFPFAPVEGDGLAIAVGANELAAQGTRSLAYRYDAQSGTYLMVAAGRLVGLQAFTALSLLTGLSFVVFVLATSMLVARLTGLSAAACGLLLLLFPESYASAYYANSTMPAVALATCGLAAASRGRAGAPIVAGALVAVAAWIRFDMVLMMPALVVLLWRNLEGRAKRLVVTAVVVVAVLSSLMMVSGASPIEILRAFSDHVSAFQSFAKTADNFTAVVTAVAAALIVLGLWQLVAGRRWWQLTVVAMGVAPTICAYGITLSTPKYLLGTLPFMTLLAASGIPWIRHATRRRWALPLLAALFLAQYVFDPFVLLSIRHRINTHDGPRDRAHLLGVPMKWTSRKLDTGRNWIDVSSEIDRVAGGPNPVVVAIGWLPSRLALYRLQVAERALVEDIIRGPSPEIVTMINDGLRVKVVVFESNDRRTISAPALEDLGLGRGSQFLLLGKNLSATASVPTAVATRVVNGHLRVWRMTVRDHGF